MKFGWILFLAAGVSSLAAAGNDTVKRLDTAARVFDEINSAPDKGIPGDLLEKATCVGIIPGMKKAGFIIGGQYGRGFLVCRDKNARSGWTAPAAMKIEGGQHRRTNRRRRNRRRPGGPER